MENINRQVKQLAESIYNIAYNDNKTDIFMASVARYDPSTGDLYVILDNNPQEVKAIPIGSRYDIGKRVMCSVNNFGNLMAIGQDEKAVENLMRRAWIAGDEYEAGETITCNTEIVQLDAVIAYEWHSTRFPTRRRSGIAYSTTDSDVGDVVYCRVYDASGKYTGYLTSNAVMIVQRYDPSEDYDFGSEISSGTMGNAGSGVELRALAGESASCTLVYKDYLAGSSTSHAPIFISELLCVSSDNEGHIHVYTHWENGSVDLSPYWGVPGNDWVRTTIGSWGGTFEIRAYENYVYVNDVEVVNDNINSGWGTFAPRWFGFSLNESSYTSGYVYEHDLSTEQESMHLVPAKIKDASPDVAGNVGLYDTVADAFYPGDGRLGFVSL